MSVLKTQYELLVEQPKSKHLEKLVYEIISFCRSEMHKGKELPYTITFTSPNITSVHELSPLLEKEGVIYSAHFDSIFNIVVNVTDFV